MYNRYTTKETEKILMRQKRAYILHDLKMALFAATGDPIELRDMGDEIIIDHCDGTAQSANVECDSLLEMVADVTKAALHGDYFDYKFEGDEDEND